MRIPFIKCPEFEDYEELMAFDRAISERHELFARNPTPADRPTDQIKRVDGRSPVVIVHSLAPGIRSRLGALVQFLGTLDDACWVILSDAQLNEERRNPNTTFKSWLEQRAQLAHALSPDSEIHELTHASFEARDAGTLIALLLEKYGYLDKLPPDDDCALEMLEFMGRGRGKDEFLSRLAWRDYQNAAKKVAQ
jgi:hypothetical protein